MQKLFNKTIAVLVALIMTMISFAPATVYAAEEIQNSLTNQSNVEFDAKINDSYRVQADIDSELELKMNLKVSNTGYVKDAVVKIEGANYSIDEDSITNMSKTEEGYSLNDVNSGEELNASAKLKFKETDSKINIQDLNKESKISLDAIYVNKDGDEKKVHKELKENIEWTAEDTEIELNQELIRYVKYDDKTLLSFKINDQIKDNKLPASSKEFKIEMPKLNKKEPVNYAVSGDHVGYNVEKEAGILTLSKTNNPDEKGLIDRDTSDELIVSFIYDTQVDSADIKTELNAKETLVDNKEVKKNIEKRYRLQEQVGSIIEVVTENTPSINKGYLLANQNSQNKLDTKFNTAYKLNIAAVETIDKVEVVEGSYNYYINSRNENSDAGIAATTASLINTKVNTSKDELVDVLGEDGTIKVFDEDNNQIAELNKDTVEAQINTNKKLKFVTSVPVKEGIVTINVDRKFDNEQELSERTISSIDSLKIDANIKGCVGDDNHEVTSVNEKFDIDLENPTSKADIIIEPNTLSTIVENENFEINVELKRKNIDDALYKNPEIRVELPEQVTNINGVTASIAYDEELTEGTVAVEGRTIVVRLNGVQTQYSTDDFIDGTKIKITANVLLDNLATSSDEKVKMTVSNESIGGNVEKEVDVKIVAPSGFITTHSIEVNGSKVTAIEKDREIEVEKGQAAVNAKISGRIINNLGEAAKEVVIVGRIPAQGNKSLSGETLGTNVNASIVGDITVENMNAKILYSENVNEDVNGNWSEIKTADTKSFKIISSEEVAQSKEVDFSYNISVPANLVSGSELLATYGVYYKNDAVEGNSYNLVKASNVGVFTEKDDTLTIETKAYDTNTGKEITGEAYAGEYITYKTTVKNIAKTKLSNVTLTAAIEGYEVPYNAQQNKEDKYLKTNSINGKYYPARFIKYNETDKNKVHSDGYIKDYEYDKNVNAIANINTVKELVNGKYVDVVAQEYMVGDLAAGQSKEIEVLVRADGYSKNYNINDIKTNFIAKSGSKTSTNSLVLKNTENDVYVDLYSASNGIIPLNETAEFEVFVENISYEDSGNIEITVDVPNGLEVISLEGYRLGREIDKDTGNYKSDVDLSKFYSKQTNKIVVNSRDLNDFITGNSLENLGPRAYTAFIFTVKAVKESNTNGLKASVKSLKYNRTIPTLVVNPKVEDVNKVITVKHSGSDTILDTEKIKYTITVKSTSNNDNSYVLKDAIPEDIMVDSIVKTIAGEKTEELSVTNSFIDRSTIKSNQTIEYTITGYVDRMLEGSTKTISVTPSFVLNGSTIFDVNTVTTVIKGTKTEKEPDDDGRIPEGDDIDDSRTYKISGVVWFDANNNGIRETGEARSTGNNVKLFDGKDILAETTVDDKGEYEFSDIKVGKYYVIISYDNKEYMVTKLRVTDATESTNNDFTAEKFDGIPVAATSVELRNQNQYSIDLGLSTRKTFDFAIDKTVSKIQIVNPEYKTREYTYVGAKTAKVELPSRNIENTTVVVEYKIKVTNEGRVAGYVKSIVDYIPQGMQFEHTMNPSWYQTQDGDLYCNLLENEEIQTGDSKEVTLYLTRRINGENLGTVRNNAEIAELYNVYGYEDADSKVANKQADEDDISSADVIILMGTGKEKASIIGITLGILALIGVASYYIKKKVINKMYTDII